jgi:DNA adenine methylase
MVNVRTETVHDGIVNVASVPHRSPFRYPGGKTWLVPLVRLWLQSVQPIAELVEPFAGGAIVGLTAVFEQLAGRLTLVELDQNVAAVWDVMLNGHGPALAECITGFEMSLANARAVLAAEPRTPLDRAFCTILRNRVQHGGILAPGASLMKDGENGRGIKSRWYAQTLHRRISDIVAIKERIAFIQGDGIAYLGNVADRPNVAFFIDPPYTVAGRRLYAHSQLDHEELFRVANTLAGDFLITYDNAEEIQALATRYRFDSELVPMKSTHHERKMELLIGRNLDWARRTHQLRFAF